MTLWKKVLLGVLVCLLALIVFTWLAIRSIAHDFHAYAQSALQEQPSTHVAAVKRDLNLINGSVQHMRFLLPPQWKEKATRLADFNTWAQAMLTSHHKLVVLFQNSEELRATGGFMGSYAVIELNEGVITRLEIQDIYVPDGQFHGMIDAPPGVKEYLSGGKGLRLPDANWNPDFPSSARDILQFFTAGGENNIDGIVTVNLSVAEDLLRVTGNIDLPDFQTTVTPENLSTVAQVDPTTFFAGSQQKKNFLSALFTALKLRMAQLSTAQQRTIVRLLITELQTKNIQLFSSDAQLESLYQKNMIDGALISPLPHAFYFYPVESNVGINKANKGVTRQIQLNTRNDQTTATMQFTNDNRSASPSARPLQYVDYQRIFVLPTTSVTSITVGDQHIQKWDEEVVTTANGAQLKQIGFLIVVPEQASVSATLQMTDPSSYSSYFLQKQSGIPPIPYSIQKDQHVENILLDHATQLPF